SILSFAVQITRVASAGSVKATSAARSIGTTRCRRPLLVTLTSCPLLAVFCSLPVWLGFIHGVPASVVVLLPTVTGVLVNVAIVPGVHITAGSFGGCGGTPLHAGSGHFSSLRISGACHCSIRS